ncbi:hypothetical protein ACHAWF_001750 [Thalassiosira exigua]
MAAVLDAHSFLKRAGCAKDCSSEACAESYLIVQSHHDYCPEDEIPTTVEDGFHDYDETCQACAIQRMHMEGEPDCPKANCDDSSGNDAYSDLIAKGCQADCSSDECRDAYFVLRATHDVCLHDTLSEAAEKGLHDLEGPCGERHRCNVEGAVKGELTCEEGEAGAEGSGGASATAGVAGAAVALIGAALIV